MVAASQKSGALLMVAPCWRLDPEVRWLRRQMEAGHWGRIVRTQRWANGCTSPNSRYS